MRHARSTQFVVALAPALLGLGIVAGQVARAEPERQDTKEIERQQKERQQQIEQHARHLESQLRPFVQAQLELARSTCGSLPAAVRSQVAKAAATPLRRVADEWAAAQFEGRYDVAGKPLTDPLNAVHEAVAAALEPHVPADELAAFRREHAAAIARRARAARMQIVIKLDQRLVLSDSQRKAIEADLETHWQPEWVVELNDAGHFDANNAPLAADFADRCIAPHLDGTQRAAWKAWSQQSGWKQRGSPRVNAFQMLSILSMPQPLPSDPWWKP